MIDKFRTLMTKEWRQLLTLGLALLVFMMTLLAQRLQAQVFTWSKVGNISGGPASHVSLDHNVVNPRDRTIALAARSDDLR